MKANIGDSLANLAMFAGTDKRVGLDGHGYVKYYDQLFSPFRGKAIKLFEIGICRGRSHIMWSYYFPKGHIYGIDIDAEELSRYLHYRDTHLDRLHMTQMDQADSVAVSRYGEENGPFDVVIDDGSHVPEHQISSFEALLPYTKRYYIIEDLHPGYWTSADPSNHKTVEYFTNIVNSQLNRQGRARAFDINFAPDSQLIESVMFVPNAIVVKIR